MSTETLSDASLPSTAIGGNGPNQSVTGGDSTPTVGGGETPTLGGGSTPTVGLGDALPTTV